MGADSLETAVRAAAWVGYELDPRQRDLLSEYHDWLAVEAAEAGGIGPHEEGRIWRRHIADSMVFGLALENSEECLDIGSGVGLPGIPLAIMCPSLRFTLLDRSGRRCDLMRRAVAVLGIENCVVSHLDITGVSKEFRSAVSRAAIPPEKMMIHVKRLLEPGGIAILGLSPSGVTRNPLPELPGISSKVVSVPSNILDTGVNHLRIEAT